MAWLSQKQIAMNNDAAGALYAAFLICLTVFWPSITLIVLVSTHAAIVVLLLACAYFDRISTSTTKGGSARSILDALGVDPDDGTRSSSLFMVLHCLGWHLQARNKMGTMVTFTHTIVLLLNLGAFLAVVHNESPPSSVLIPQEHTDHTRFGIVPGGHFSSMDDHSSLKLLQLAQRGYYYAEEYNGDIGTMPGKRCDGTDGIRCYAVGVRHFLDGHTSVFQPLPTPAYDVDVQVAVSMAAERNPAVGRCTSLEPIYTQQIIVNDTHQSEIFKLSPQPLVQLAWGTEADRPLCPWGHAGAEGHLGCMQKQRQTEVYTTRMY